MEALARRGPGFNPRTLEAIRRIDPRFDLVWCNLARYWIVVRRGARGIRSFWNGSWHLGWEIVLRWRGVDGEYRSPMPYEHATFLPLDNRLVRRLRFDDCSAAGKAALIGSTLEKIERKRIAERNARRRGRRDEAQAYFHGRHVLHRVRSVGGFLPGQVNDYETEAEAIAKLSARGREAFLRVRSGQLPWEDNR